MIGSVLILSGPPGAGKSTVAAILARESASPAVHLHADDFYDRFIKSGYVLPWLVEAQAQNATVANALAAAAFAYAQGGYWTIVDGIVEPWALAAYRELARTRSIALDYVVLRPKSADVAFARVLQRATHGLKAEDVVRELHRQFSDIGALERHAFDSTPQTADETARVLRGRLAKGEFRLADA
jgi:adenylate kinase family enzyme